MRLVGFDLCLEQGATLEEEKDSAASDGLCSVLHLMTGSHGHCVTSKADSSEERNPIPQDYCTGRAAEDRQLPVSFLILKYIPTSEDCNLRNTTLHSSVVLLKFSPVSVTFLKHPNPLKVLCSLIYRIMCINPGQQSVFKQSMK